MRGSSNIRLNLFLQDVVPAFVLVLLVSVGLVYVVSFGFESLPELRGNMLLEALLVVPLLILMFAGTWSKRSVIPCAIASVVYALIVIVCFCTLLAPESEMFTNGQLNDVAENPLPFAIVLIVTPVLVFLLSRKLIGCVVLFMGSALACASVQFLFRDWSDSGAHIVVSVGTVVLAAVIFIYQRYRQSLSQATRSKASSFWQVALAATILSLLFAGVGFLVFTAIIQPLGVQTPEIKPFTHYFTRPIVEYSGVYDEQSIIDPDKLTDQLTDDIQDTEENTEGGMAPDEGQDDGGSLISTLFKSVTSFDADDWTQQFKAITYESVAVGSLILVLVVAAIVALIGWIQHRRWLARLQRWEQYEIPERIRRSYQYMDRGLKTLHIERPASLTPLEYAISAQSELAPFVRDTDGVDWLMVTVIYQRACFDVGRADDSDWNAVRKFYIAFRKNARMIAGLRQWIVLSWRV